MGPLAKLLILSCPLFTLAVLQEPDGYIGSDVKYFAPGPETIDPDWIGIVRPGPKNTLRVYPRTQPRAYDFLLRESSLTRETIFIRVCYVPSEEVRYPRMKLCYYNENALPNSICDQGCGFMFDFGQNSFKVNYNGEKTYERNFLTGHESCFILQQRQTKTTSKMRLMTDDMQEIAEFDTCKMYLRKKGVIVNYQELLVWANVSDSAAQINFWIEKARLIAPGEEIKLPTTTEVIEETTETVVLHHENEDASANAGLLSPMNIGVIIVAVGVAVSVVLFCTMFWIHRNSAPAPPVTKPQIIRSITAGSQDANKPPPKQPSHSASKKEVQQKSSKSTKQRSTDAARKQRSPDASKKTTSQKKTARKAVKSLKERPKAPPTTILPPPMRNKSVFSRLHKRETAPRPAPKATGFIEGQDFLSNDESTMPTVTPQMATAAATPIVPSKEAMTARPKTSADTVTPITK